METPTHHSLLKGMAVRFGLITLGSGAISITGFLVAILVVKSFTKEATGHFATCLSALAMALALTDLGFRRGVTLEIATRLRSASQTVGQVIGAAILFRATLLIIITGVGAMLINLGIGEPSHSTDPNNGTLNDGLAVIIWLLAPLGIITTCIAVCEGFQHMGQSLLCAISQQLARLIGAMITAAAALTWLALFRWWAVLFLIAAIVSLIVVHRLTLRQGVRWAFDRHILFDLCRRSFPLYLGGLCDRIASPMLIGLSYVIGDAETAAAFFVLRIIGGVGIEIAMPFGRVLLPAVPNINDEREAATYLRAIDTALRLIILGSACYLVLVTIGGSFALNLLSSDQADYTPYLLPLLLVAAGSFVECQRGVWDVLLIGANKTTWYATAEWVRLIVVTSLGILALNYWGVTGLAATYVVGAVALWAAKVFSVAHATHLRVWTATVATIVVLVGCTALAVLIHEFR